jgi:hypothetical protein
VAEIIPAHAKGKTIEFWFQDEARVGQKGTLTRIWARRGFRPRMKRDQRHDNAYIFGAVCPSRDIGAALVLPHVNIEAMNLHLAEIAKAIPLGIHAVVIIDGAGWHKEGGELIVPDNLSLLKLPPYSPELNAQENIWQFLRQNFLAGRIFKSYDDIVDACCNAWKALTQETGRIASIATRDWLQCVSS